MSPTTAPSCTARRRSGVGWRFAASLLVSVAAASCAIETTSEVPPEEEFESLVGTPVPDSAAGTTIVSEGRADPYLTARFELPRNDLAAFLDAAGLKESPAAGVVEIERVPDELNDEFESIGEFESTARDDGARSVSVHLSTGDPLVVFVQASSI